MVPTASKLIYEKMRFIQLTSLCLFFLTFGLVIASPTPRAIEKRDGPVADILNTLQSTIGPIIDQISEEKFVIPPCASLTIHMLDSLVSGSTATSATATPLVNQLVTALNTASGSISGLSSTSETAEDVASQLASVTTVSSSVLGHWRADYSTGYR